MYNRKMQYVIKSVPTDDKQALEDLLNRMPSTNKTVIENLIKCGAFNEIEENPYKYLPVLEFSSKAKSKADYKKGNISLK